MHFWKQFKAKACLLNLDSSTKGETLEVIIAHLAQCGALPKEHQTPALKTLNDREQLASTGVGMGVAIPHVQVKGIERAICTLAIHPGGVEWASPDGAPVHILFTVLRPDAPAAGHDPQRHLEMMRWIAKLSRDGDFRRFAVRSKTKTELVDLLKEMSTV
jgi:mannitol/fructose-specific phosphotransferase system IIA component (Ntr-type)